MDPKQERERDQAAYRRLSESIAQHYPPGRFLAITDGQVVADAARFEELHTALRSMGRDPTQMLIVQAGIEYPENAVIFGLDGRP